MHVRIVIIYNATKQFEHNNERSIDKHKNIIEENYLQQICGQQKQQPSVNRVLFPC